eukprot:NODE_134_length_16603_cov_0.784052.p6 type:complete len:295 gc:universal NODE_134_length_16603_cov_0.784052:9372-10256(+)
MKHLISLKNLHIDEIREIVKLAHQIKADPLKYKIQGKKSMAIYFEKPSTRTRLSAHVACSKLDLQPISLDPNALQLGKESIRDTAEVMSSMVNGIFARASDQFLIQFAKYSKIPVINALSEKYHPTQILADLMTMEEAGIKKKCTVAWIGDGNNILNSMLVSYPRMGIQLKIACPPGYGPLKEALSLSKSSVCPPIFTNPMEAAKNADFIMTDVFISMGQEEEKTKRLNDFKGYQVNEKLLAIAKSDCKFMHCLPRTLHEVTDDVFYGKQSLVFGQAENRLHTIQAVFYHFLKD